MILVAQPTLRRGSFFTALRTAVTCQRSNVSRLIGPNSRVNSGAKSICRMTVYTSRRDLIGAPDRRAESAVHSAYVLTICSLTGTLAYLVDEKSVRRGHRPRLVRILEQS